MVIKNLVGQKFGRLTVLQFDKRDKRGEAFWLCQCECGNQTSVSGYKLRSGATKSCGCLQLEHRKKGFHKSHGLSNTKLYVIWQNMKHRCHDPKNLMYKHYGGRGIKVCQEWLESFEAFAKWAFDAGYCEGLSIERINVNGNYCPSNCKWVTKKQQYLNRTDTHLLTAFNKTQTIKEWADESGIKYDTIERRINQYGWSAEDAVTIKPHTRHP